MGYHVSPITLEVKMTLPQGTSVGSRCCRFRINKSYLFLERGEGKGRGRETSMWEGNIDLLPPKQTHPGTEPQTQARALPRNQTGNLFALWDDAQPTEPIPVGAVCIVFYVVFISSVRVDPLWRQGQLISAVGELCPQSPPVHLGWK